MTTLTLLSGGSIQPATPLPRGRCASHSRYHAGCLHCQTSNRERRRAVYRAQAYGTHQPGHVPALGAARRLQALSALGYEAVHIAPLLNVHPDVVRRWRSHDRPTITRRRHNDITALADRLDGIPGPSRRARTIAHRKQWVPLAAWDDIDNPADKPHVRAPHQQTAPSTLISRVLNDDAHIDTLTAGEQASLWNAWAAQREASGLPDGPKSFGRQFDISPHRAARIIAIANNQINQRKVA